ncbi:MAG: rod shape-determining protein MreD [Defluviitaleaceae bacterium]|nr:rod shape-determining protein MreD [Defluviitaleaceae bacterium]
MMIRVFALTVLILLNFVLQATLFPHIAIMGVTPDTALILIISYAILRGDIEGAIFGFFAGLVQDALGGMFLGFFALLGFLTGYICGKPFRDFFKDNYFLPFFVVLVISLLYQLASYVGTVMFLGGHDFWFYFRTIILPKTIYTTSFSVPVYGFMHFLNGRIEKWRAMPSEGDYQ